MNFHQHLELKRTSFPSADCNYLTEFTVIKPGLNITEIYTPMDLAKKASGWRLPEFQGAQDG